MNRDNLIVAPAVRGDKALANPPLEVVYITHSSYAEANEHVLVFACSDPRYQVARKEFIEERYGLSQYDPMIFPGGPASLLLSSPLCFFVRSWVKTLHAAHNIRQTRAFAHADCRYYKERYPRLSVGEQRERQIADLRLFQIEIRKMISGVEATTYYAEPADGHIQFLKV